MEDVEERTLQETRRGPLTGRLGPPLTPVKDWVMKYKAPCISKRPCLSVDGTGWGGVFRSYGRSFRESVTCLTKLRVGCTAVVARMVWLLPGLGRRDKVRLATTWACSCVILTFSSVTVSNVSPSTASVRGDTT